MKAMRFVRILDNLSGLSRRRRFATPSGGYALFIGYAQTYTTKEQAFAARCGAEKVGEIRE